MPDLAIESLAEPEDIDDNFVAFRNIPIFDEHEIEEVHPETGARRVVRYTRAILEAIADNMNRRAANTGDLSPLCIGHTHPDPRAPKPEVIGHAKNYRVLPWRDRYAIYSDWIVHREDKDKVRKNPRRSVEVIPEDNLANRWFDPIALLGAETPRRDLGMLYSRPDNTKRQRYSIPSTYNGFAPAPTGDNKQRNMMGDDCGPPVGEGVRLHPDDLQQLFAMLEASIDSKLSARLQNMGPDAGINAAVDPVPVEPQEEIDPEPDPLGLDPEGAGPAETEDEPVDPMAGTDPDPTGGDPAADPSLLPGDDDDDGADELELEDEEDLKNIRSKQTYAMEFTRLFQCGELAECKTLVERLAGTEEGLELHDDMADCLDGAAKIHYQNTAGHFYPAIQRREIDPMAETDYKIRYQQSEAAREKLMGELAAAKARVAELEGQVAEGERRKILYALENDGVIFDLNEELENAAGFSEDQFKRHVETMKQRYQRKPPSQMIPTDDEPGARRKGKSENAGKPPAHSRESQDGADPRRQIEEVASARAAKICYQRRQEGEKPNFDQAMAEETAKVRKAFEETGAVPAE